jgi:hypothetical protein
MERKDALHAFTVRDAADGKCFVQSTALTPNHDTGEYLDSLLISLHNPRMDTDGVAHFERIRVGFLLLFLDGIDDLIHKLVAGRAGAGAHSYSKASNLQLEFVRLIVIENSSTTTITSMSTRICRN